jgi:hypothetical protein
MSKGPGNGGKTRGRYRWACPHSALPLVGRVKKRVKLAIQSRGALLPRCLLPLFWFLERTQ